MKLCGLILVVLYVCSNFAIAADKRAGQVLAKLGDKKPLMKFQSARTTNSKGSTYEASFQGLDGKVIVKEVSKYGADNKLIEYSVEQNQYGCRARVTRKGSKYQLSTKVNGKSKGEVVLSDAAQIFSGYGIERLIINNWKGLQAGQPVDFTFYAGCNNQASVAVQLRKMAPQKIGDKTFIAIKSGPKGSKGGGIYYYDSNKKLHAYSGPLQVIIGGTPAGAISF